MSHARQAALLFPKEAKVRVHGGQFEALLRVFQSSSHLLCSGVEKYSWPTNLTRRLQVPVVGGKLLLYCTLENYPGGKIVCNYNGPIITLPCMLPSINEQNNNIKNNIMKGYFLPQAT